MQRSIAEWLTASRGRALAGGLGLAVFGALLLPFSSWLPGALIVLVTLLGRPVPDWQVALVAGVTLAWWLLAAVGPVVAILTSAALVLLPFLLGRLLARTRNLSLVFQVATLVVLAMLGLVHAVLADPPGVWRPLLTRAAAELERMGALVSGPGTSSSEVIAQATAQMWGVASWLVLLNAMVSIFVGLYWAGRVEGRPTLGPAFRSLKAGRTLALLALVALGLSYGLRLHFARDAVWLFGGAFVLQGLAILHAARESLRLSTGWLAASYVFLFVPLTTPVVTSGLAAFGFLDNWYPIRSRFKTPPDRPVS